MKQIVLLFLGLSFFSLANPVQSLEDLMRLVQQESFSQNAEFKKREQRFLREKNRRQVLLNKAQAELKEFRRIQKILLARYNNQEKSIAALQRELNIIVGSMGELFGAVKQVAGDFSGKVASSIVSSEIPNRTPFLIQIANQKEMPDIHTLRRLWAEIMVEMTELGQVRKFEGLVVLNNGTKEKRDIVRVGGFNLVSDGKYLAYQQDTKQIMELTKQPPRHLRSHISSLESATSGDHTFALDPSRGTLLSVLLKVPSLRERIQQGGLVGYFIILLFFIGLGIGAHRFIIIRREGDKIKEQLKTDQADESNPIGQLRKTFEQYQNQDIETLEMKLDEVVIKSLPTFEKGIGLIRIFASVAPLCGLLGTVLGMINTFQAITLFGTGDPKLMAGGISEALITTTLGLCCAIPLLFVHTFVSSRAKSVIQILEEQMAGLIARKAHNKAISSE